MKHIKFLSVVAFLFFAIGSFFVNASTQQKEVNVSVNITSYFSKDNIQTVTIPEKTYGSNLSFENDLPNSSGYEFSFWLVNDNIRQDLPMDHQFVITYNTDITAIYKEIGKFTVLFVDVNGQVLDIQYVSPNGNAFDPDLPILPSKPGYKIAQNKWDKSYDNIIEDTVISLVYERDDSNVYTLTVESGGIIDQNNNNGIYDFNAVATIQANEAPQGKVFSHWQVGDKIVSHQSIYRFTILKDTNIKAVYQDISIGDVPLITLSNALQLRENYNTYLAQFYLPENYTLVEYGLLTSANVEVLNVNSLDIHRIKGLKYFEETNEFVMSIPTAEAISIRAYLITRDADDNLLTVYDSSYSLTLPATNIEGSFTDEFETSVSKNNGWVTNGTQKAGGIALDSQGTYLKTPIINSNHGEITFEMLAWASSANSAFTFRIDALDLNDAIIASSGSIALKDTTFGTVYQKYVPYSYTFLNSNNDIAYLKLTYNKEDTGVNIRIANATVKTSGEVKEISHILPYFPNINYLVDETLNFNNLNLVIYYSDGTLSSIPITPEMVSGFSSSTSGEFTLTITYLDNSNNIKYYVEKIDPQYTLPIIEDIEYNLGMTLADILLPTGFSWQNPNQLLTTGNYTELITYTPSDLNRYHVVTNIEVNFKVVPKTTSILIYEIYGGGGNSGAIYTNDYIVLFNNTNNDINLEGYSYQYASATATTFSPNPLNGVIYAKSYYLIALASYGPNGSPLPVSPNFAGTINMSQTAGQVLIAHKTTAVTDINDPSIIDYVSYSGLSSKLSARRNSYIDNDKFTDFTIGEPDLSYLEETLELTSISVRNLQSIYELNDPINIYNAELILHYANGSKEYLPLSIDAISGFDSSRPGNYQLTITYQELTFDYPYQIIDTDSTEEVYVYYIDIGATGGKAGEAALIKVGDTEILIDAGDTDSKSNEQLLSFLGTKVTDGIIEYVIATHPDSDHIGGMLPVFDQYKIDNVIHYSTGPTGTNLRTNFEAKVNKEGSYVYYIHDLVNTSPILEISSSVNLRFYDTTYLKSSNSNASSIVFVLNAFSTRILFNGDAETQQENVYANLIGDIDIFKMGHHGAAAGTSTNLLSKTTPEVAIVNNGNYLGNSYNHPTYEALSRIYTYSNMLPVYSVTGGNQTADIMHQRNGTITVTVSNDSYQITSERYFDNPIELSATDYWNDSSNPYWNLGYYYALATGVDKSELKTRLHDIIDDHITFNYDFAKTALKETDKDPNNPSNVILFYTGRSQSSDSFGSGVDQWNREHVWAKSHGGFGETAPAGSDLHHLRPTDASVNSARGSLDFDEGGSIVRDTYGAGSSYCYRDSDSFEPRDEVKGDVARILFYMAVRYEGDKTGEPDLELNDLVNNGTSPYMGRLSILLKWHLQDPVDDFERNRNEVIYSYQKNRNPFIDHPEYALMIFG